MTELSVFIPTVGNRPKMLARVKEAVYLEHPDAQIFVVENVSWGKGLNLCAKLATGSYWSCYCDDTVPLPGWFEAGRAMLDAGAMPASRYLNADGSPLKPGWDDAPHGARVDWCRSFLLTSELYAQVGSFIDATWMCDIDYSERINRAGWEILACDGFAFTHLDGPRDWQTPEVDAYEREQYTLSHRRQGVL